MVDSVSAIERVAPRHEDRRQAKFIMGGLIVVAAVVYLILTGVKGSATYYLTIEELVARAPVGRTVRVAGVIQGESISWTPRDLLLEFKIAAQGRTLPVRYHGSRPDMFRDGAEVVVEGQYTREGIFDAHSLLLKCPSKYEGAQ